MKEKETTLKIYFTSDIHGYFYPTSYGDESVKEMGLFRCVPGFVKDENTLVIDGGDILQGSAYTYYTKQNLKNAAPLAKVMNACGYDIVTLGNHDFNYGTKYLYEYLEALDADCVCQNVTTEDGTVKFPYQIKTMPNGLRVGVVGIVTDFVNLWEKEENLTGLMVTDTFTAAKEALLECKKEADVCICIYHGGFEADLNSGNILSDTTENVGYRICKELDFDVLLTGHQHMSIDGQYVHGTYVVQSCEYAREYQTLEIRVGCDGLEVTSKRCKAEKSADATLCEEFAKTEKSVQEWLDQPAGNLNRELLPEDKLSMALHGSPIADFFNQVQLYFSNAQISSVGLANELAGFHKEVKNRDIIATYPYPNTLVVLEITGAQLKQVMERSAEYFDVDAAGCIQIADSFLNPKAEHYNYDYYAGVTYTIDPKQPIGSRITSLQYQDKEVTPLDVFTICLNNYRASGAGGYPVYQNCKVIKEINVEMVELLMEYFEKHPQVVV